MTSNKNTTVNMLFTLITFSLLCFPVLGTGNSELENPIASELLDKYRENQSKMTKCIVFGESSTETGSSNNGDTRFYKTKGELRYDGDRVDFRFSTWSNLDSFDVNIESKEAASYKYYIWDGNTSYDYRRGITTQKGKLFIEKNDNMKGPQLSVNYDGASLLGIYEGDSLPVGTILKKATKLELRKNMEQAVSFKCYVLDALTPYGKYTIWIDPEHGYNIAKAEVTKGEKDLVWNDEILLRENRAGVMTAISFSYEVIRFEKLNDVWVPMEAKHNYKRDYKNASFDYTYLKTHNKRTKVVLNPDFEKIGAFIHDVQEGDEIYNVEDNLKTSKTEQPVSLVGKTLPELHDFNIEPKPDFTNKIILVCFFDIDQRTSRNAILELSKKAKELKGKDVSVILIHASKIEQANLDMWIKETGIPFPVGMIKANEEKTKLNWGVKALPWLILTDKEHIVREEGFGLGELDEIIENADKSITQEEIDKLQQNISETEIRRLGGEIVVKTSENGYEYTEVGLYGPNYKNQWTGSDEEIKYLKWLPNLRNLRIQEVETFNDKSMTQLKDIKSLESLMIVRCDVSDEGLVYLKDLTNLEFLGLLDNYQVTDKTLDYMKDLTKLKSLRLDNTRITDNGIIKLKQYGILNKIEFLVLNGTQVTNDGLTNLRGIDKLKNLYLVNTQISDDGLKCLEDLLNLESIILNETRVTDIGMVYLKRLKNLNLLYLVNTQITDKGLEQIEEFKGLVQLWIGGTKITDAGLIHIGELINLKSIDLESTRITDKGLEYVKHLKNLNELFLNQTDITLEGYMNIKEALPGCQIHWESNPSRLVQPRPASLIGKPLPDMNNLLAEFKQESIQSKSVLICFWDLEQRPSRNCIQELNKKVEELKVKDITVIAIQASKTDKNSFNDWIKEYNINIPMAFIEDNSEQAKFNWGIKALPWLILTDKEHIVTAEGFSINELDDKIKGN